MRRGRLSLSFALVATLFAIATGCGVAAAKDSIVTKADGTGQLTIGIRFSQPGMSKRTIDGRFVGFDVDVARFVAVELDVDEDGIEWRDLVAADREAAIRSGSGRPRRRDLLHHRRA